VVSPQSGQNFPLAGIFAPQLEQYIFLALQNLNNYLYIKKI